MQTNPTPDFTEMNAPELLQVCGDDASKWAAAFCQTAAKLGIKNIDEGWMIGWFANAIETAWIKRIERAEPETRPASPYRIDGSAPWQS